MKEKRPSNFMRFNCEIRACNQSVFELTFTNPHQIYMFGVSDRVSVCLCKLYGIITDKCRM